MLIAGSCRGQSSLELVSADACRDHQEAVGMGMKLPIEVREGQWACECRDLLSPERGSRHACPCDCRDR